MEITSPADGESFFPGDPISFVGQAFDENDAVVNDIEWHSSIDGRLGSAKTFSSSDLSEGVHTISLTATHPSRPGVEKTVSITILVGGLQVWFDGALIEPGGEAVAAATPLPFGPAPPGASQPVRISGPQVSRVRHSCLASAEVSSLPLLSFPLSLASLQSIWEDSAGRER